MNIYLTIDGRQAFDLSHYTIRFVEAEGDPTPVLYHDGKRVTKKWFVSLLHWQAADEHGGNANTDNDSV